MIKKDYKKEVFVDMDSRQVRDSLRIVEQSRGMATRYSENNGVVQLVWGVVVLVCLVGFDIIPWLVEQLTSRATASWLGPLGAASVIALASRVPRSGRTAIDEDCLCILFASSNLGCFSGGASTTPF
jgi:hypothetical protein